MSTWLLQSAALCPVLALGQGGWVGLVVVLMVGGLVFLGAEIFVIPGFGFAGVVGIGSLVVGVTLAWVRYGSLVGMGLLLFSLAATVAALWVVFKTQAGQRLMLGDSLKDAVAVSDEGRQLLGAQGVAITMLRPSGSAEFGADRVEVETDGEYVAKGTPVRVVSVQMGRVVVEVVPEAGNEKEG